MNMRPEEARALLPQRPDPVFWLAFVLLGLIGTYLAGSVMLEASGLNSSSLLVAAGVFCFYLAYDEARDLDESEVWA